jgi:hypothetical protein
VFARPAEELEEQQLFGRPESLGHASGGREATPDELARMEHFPIKGLLTDYLHSRRGVVAEVVGI